MTTKEESSFTITNPFTGAPLKETPDGTSLAGVTFKTKEEALNFFSNHGGNPVEVVHTLADDDK